MINLLNLLLRKLFETPLGLTAEQIGFEPPDDDWRKYVTETQKAAINIYLVDLRENTGRRSNEQLRKIQNGGFVETPAPHWLDCHYLITAWDSTPANLATGVEPTLTEHALLYEVTAALVASNSLVARDVYGTASLPADFPAALVDVKLPVNVLPAEGFPKMAEFWGTMGTGFRWKPVVYLIVTLPVIIDQPMTSTRVSTLVTRYRQQVPAEDPEVVVITKHDQPNP